MNILPQSTLRIVRQLTDPQESGTNYVRAVIRNSATGDILTTVSLTDAGSQRFTGSYQTPPDASGQGYYIDVTTTVYTDSGYTTKNLNYAIETNTHHVYQERVHFGGGGSDIDYKKLRQIVQEEVGKIEKTEIPETQDLTPSLSAMESRLRDAIKGVAPSIQIPEQVRPDIDGAVSRLQMTIDDAVNTLLIALDQKEVTPETDLTPIQEDIANLPIQQMIDAISLLNERLQTLQNVVDTQQEVTTMRQAAEEFMKKVSPKTLNVPKEKPQDMLQLRASRLLGV